MKVYARSLILFFISILIVASSVAADDSNVERNIAFYSNLWDEIINHGNLEMISNENFVPEVIVHASPENIAGIDAMKDYYANYLTGFSDIEFSINDIFGQGNKLVKHWTFKGTHTGDFFGIAPSGRAVALEGVTLVRFEDGKVAEEHDFFDNYDFLQQLGLITAE